MFRSLLEWFVYFIVLYPLMYLAYTILVVRLFGLLTEEQDLKAASPRVYRVTTVIMGVLGPPLLIIGFISLLAGLAAEGLSLGILFLYPGISLTIAAYHPGFRRKPYRFLLVAPLVGQASLARVFIDWATLWPFTRWLLPVLFHIRPIGPEQYIYAENPISYYYALAGYMLFPVPGYGGINAVFSLARNTAGPMSLTSIVLFLEWLMFYRALKRVLRDS